MTSSKLRTQHWSERVSGPKKLIACFFMGMIFYVVLSFLEIQPSRGVILSWDVFCLSMLCLSWILFFTTNSKDLCFVVAKQDDGVKAIFAIVLVATSLSTFGTIILMIESTESEANKLLHTIISLSPIFFSWFLLHTIFAIRYAHLYHDHDELKTGTKVGGIEFPSKEEPDYFDFTYFSFVIGMTFQVSDITVSSKTIRKYVLMHSLLSFFFNTIIVALTINTLASLKD